MEVTVNVPENVAAEARARGVSVEVYVQEILAQRALQNENSGSLQSIASAVSRILELRQGNKLDGLRITDLIHEGHRY